MIRNNITKTELDYRTQLLIGMCSSSPDEGLRILRSWVENQYPNERFYVLSATPGNDEYLMTVFVGGFLVHVEISIEDSQVINSEIESVKTYYQGASRQERIQLEVALSLAEEASD